MKTYSENPNTEKVLDHLATLYELSLAIGTSFDLESNCKTFFKALISRRNLNLCAIYLHNDHIIYETEDEQDNSFRCIYSTPEVCPKSAVLPLTSQLANELSETGMISRLLSDTPELDGIARGVSDNGKGIVSLFSLDDFGFVMLVNQVRQKIYEDWELNMMRRLMEKFSNSVQACLDHSRLLNESTRRLALQERLARTERLESLGLLAGGVAHDLNNILGPLVAYPEMMREDLPVNSPIRSDLMRIEESAIQASRIIKDLLTLARYGKSDLQIISIAEATERFLQAPAFLNLCARQPQIRFQQRLESAGKAMGTDSHIMRILLNLITNAFEAFEEQGAVNLILQQVHLTESQQGYDLIPAGSYQVLRVSDNAGGIAEAALPRIFEPFYSTKELGRSGTGLGLAVVYGLVKEMGGYCDVETSSEGTSFSVFLPNA